MNWYEREKAKRELAESARGCGYTMLFMLALTVIWFLSY